MMNKLYVSLPKLSFWKGVFEFARFMAVISYLRVLSERNDYIGFWLVVVIFSFDPIVKAIQSRKGKG